MEKFKQKMKLMISDMAKTETTLEEKVGNHLMFPES